MFAGDHITHLYKSLVKYYGIFNHIKHFVNRKIIRQLYFALVHSKIKYGIEDYGSCSKVLLDRIQTLQNGLVKILLNLNRKTGTNQILCQEAKEKGWPELYHCG